MKRDCSKIFFSFDSKHLLKPKINFLWVDVQEKIIQRLIDTYAVPDFLSTRRMPNGCEIKINKLVV